MNYEARRPYSVIDGANVALDSLLLSIHGQLADEIVHYAKDVLFSSPSPCGAALQFPCPLKEQEATAAIKALEACVVAAIADLRYGVKPRPIHVDIEKIACFLMSAYLTTIDGLGKGDARVRAKIPDTDLNQAQSNVYRRLSANLYETKDRGRYYHIHGSLDATTTLKMLGLPAFRPDLADYRQCIEIIERAVKKCTVSELEELNNRHRQAGIEALKWEQFRRTAHGQAICSMPPFTITSLEHSTPPVPFPRQEQHSGANTQVLQGIKVLELCRVIAGPTIGRSLAAHGAQVLKVTSDRLPDVPFFQLDVNTGKHTTSLDLKTARDRAIFDTLLAEADVLIDGYRPGALEKLGYGPLHLSSLARRRGKGFVYVAEDCFGGPQLPSPRAQPNGHTATGYAANGHPTNGHTTTTTTPNHAYSRPSAPPTPQDWSTRPGWQQIADCATGVAWAQGVFMGLAEPVVPPFPMSDYGTGALGAAAALAALYDRSLRGGSYACRTSLCQYDVFLLRLGAYPDDVQRRIRAAHGFVGGAGEKEGGNKGFFGLRHGDSVDEVGKRALRSMRRVAPGLFGEGMMREAWSTGFKGVVRWPREAVRVGGVRVGYVRAGRPNGFDEATWEGWEVDEEVLEGEDGG
ncbi:CoA-transferase family III [Coniochaeta ligniaria NRRL 30616]|uniref:CoA-transferase family III n=1 Tax=Coniochaeta ligniaria NRRL 30616 TaxID=1408157 RepID=A0A1J7J240_9PEZI|nr:CoA-transferase family III [Coniochaeta ligniaria NRRL 30616]